MDRVEEINNELREILIQGLKMGKTTLTEEQIRETDFAFLPYISRKNERRFLITPPISVVRNITKDLYEEIMAVCTRKNPEILNYSGLLQVIPSTVFESYKEAENTYSPLELIRSKQKPSINQPNYELAIRNQQ